MQYIVNKDMTWYAVERETGDPYVYKAGTIITIPAHHPNIEPLLKGSKPQIQVATDEELAAAGIDRQNSPRDL